MSSTEKDGETSRLSEEILDSKLREIQKLEGHTSQVWSIAWNPAAGGSFGTLALIASCSEDRTVRIWEQSSLSSSSFRLKEVLEREHAKTVRSCAWSPSGKMLAVASFDVTIAIWENIGGKYIRVSTLEGPANEVESVCWNWSDLFIATCGRDKSVWMWGNTEKAEYYLPEDYIQVEGEKFAAMRVSGERNHTQKVQMVVWHPHDYILFSCSYDNTIKIWKFDGEEESAWYCVQTLNVLKEGHTAAVWALSFNPDGDKFVSCSADLTLKIWEVDLNYSETRDILNYAHWKLLTTLSGYHDKTIVSVHWSRDGMIATGAEDKCIRLFAETEDNSEGKSTFELYGKVANAHRMDVTCVQWSATQPRLLASASEDATVKIWELLPSRQPSPSESGSELP